jgi:hypothetical protein
VVNDIEVVHADSSAYVAMADAPLLTDMMVLPAYLVVTLLIFSLLVSLGRLCTHLFEADCQSDQYHHVIIFNGC